MLKRFCWVILWSAIIIFVPYYWVDLMKLVDKEMINFLIRNEPAPVRWFFGVWMLSACAGITTLVWGGCILIKYIIYGRN